MVYVILNQCIVPGIIHVLYMVAEGNSHGTY